MKRSILLMGLMLSVAPMATLSLVPAALAQTQEASTPLLKAGMTQGEPRGPVQIPDAPQLPYHYGARPVAPNGEKFGNVAAVALMPNGDLLVFNR
ncbi:MAG TPA: hypothetical protein VHV26_06645, partial [Rhizomicrobium sp.]|nr:hypothetical protein [Rhizomicrobium sp.]